mmetsp:Transcript_46384/g.122524  ORF Transcript_46384/g.122524 Transcript_46384/m.122524 type:complete len:206 (+) Transcript_46384:29-646(+)
MCLKLGRRGFSGVRFSARPTTWLFTTTSKRHVICCTSPISKRRPWSLTSMFRFSTTASWLRWACAPSVLARSRKHTTTSWLCACTTRPGSCLHRVCRTPSSRKELRSRSARRDCGSSLITCTSTSRSSTVRTISVRCCWRCPIWLCRQSIRPTSGSSRAFYVEPWISTTSRSSQGHLRTPRRLSSAQRRLSRRAIGRALALRLRT